MEQKMTIMKIISGAIVLGSLTYFYNLTDLATKIKNDPHKYLICEMQDGEREIDKDKIVSFDDISGYWTFTNGYAKNCKVVEIGGLVDE